MTNLSTSLPLGPIVDKDGKPTLQFMTWMRVILARTGGFQGVQSTPTAAND